MPDTYTLELQLPGYCSLTRTVLTCLALSMTGVQNSLAFERDLTVNVTRNACGTSIDLQMYQNLFLSYEGHNFDEDICEITLNNKVKYTELCMQKQTAIKSSARCTWMFSAESLDVGKGYMLDWSTYICYLNNWCDDTKTLRMQFNTKTWEDNTTLVLKIFLKKDYTKSYDQDNWSSWSSSNSYDDYEDDDDDDDGEGPPTIVYVLIILIAITCVGCCGCLKSKSKGAAQNASNAAGTNHLPTSDLAPNATLMQAERPPEFQDPSAPPAYSTLVMQYEQNGTGFMTSHVNTNSNPNGLSNSQSNLESQSNQDDSTRVTGNISEAESQPPPPDYYDVMRNLKDYKKQDS